METALVESENFAVLPQNGFVELTSIIEVIDVAEEKIVWNLDDDLDGDYEFTMNNNSMKIGEEDSDMENVTSTFSQLANFAPIKEIGFLNTLFVAILTLLIYPVVMIGNKIWKMIYRNPLFREMFRIVSSTLRTT